MTLPEFSYSLNQLTNSLKPFALRLTKDMDDANDLLQDTIEKAFSNKEKFREGTNLKGWLYTIMKNIFITNYHRMIRRGTFVDTSENNYYINSGSVTIENEAFGDITFKDIHKAIENMDEVYNIPFMMHYKGFKYKEIADTLNIPIGTVKNRIHIARKLLQNKLSVYQTNY